MRKILLGTTAVCGAALLGATHAQAQTAPTLRIGGYFEFNVGYIDDTQDRGVTVGAGTAPSPFFTTNRDKWDFRQGDTEIQLFVTGKAANGLSYGFTIELQLDGADTVGAGTALDTDEAYAFVSSPTLGTIRLGDEDSAASLLQTRLPTIVGMGPDNMIDEFIANAADGTRYLISGINDGSDATKIIYLSPQFFGFDFGVSFAPNGREGESFRSTTATAAAAPTGVAANGQFLQRDPNDSLRNEISGAIRYRGTFSNIGVAASFGAMRADAQEVASTAVQLQDVTAYHLGLQLSGFGLTVGGEYNWGKYSGGSVGRAALAQGLGNSSNWAVGVTYTMGALSFGAFYGEATRDAFGANPDREQKVWGIGLAYNLAPGWDVVANYSQQEDSNIYTSAANPTTLAPAGNRYGQRNRDIDIFIVGTRIAF